MIEIMKGLSDENRLRLFYLLSQGEFCVCEIEVLLGMTQTNASRHLSKLRQSGLIQSQKDAQWVHYKVSTSFKLSHGDFAESLLRHLAEEPTIMADSRRLDHYRRLGLNCTDITGDRERVVQQING